MRIKYGSFIEYNYKTHRQRNIYLYTELRENLDFNPRWVVVEEVVMTWEQVDFAGAAGLSQLVNARVLLVLIW